MDVDEVLADFQTPALEVMSSVTGLTYKPDDFTTWDIFGCLTEDQRLAVFKVLEQPGWCASLEVLPGSQEGIEELRSFCDVFPVTSPFHSAPWVNERAAWLEKNFGWKRREIVHTGSKFRVIGDALVDDNPDHKTAWDEAHPGGLALLWHIHNTRHMGYEDARVRSWPEVSLRIRAHAKHKNALDLLREREWSYSRMSYGYVCMECGALQQDGHRTGCRLAHLLRTI